MILVGFAISMVSCLLSFPRNLVRFWTVVRLTDQFYPDTTETDNGLFHIQWRAILLLRLSEWSVNSIWEIENPTLLSYADGRIYTYM